jgi:hypothetical protein
MTRHDEQDWSSYTCPHCGENIWDMDGSVSDSYVEDDYYVQEITCGCGAEVRYFNRIDDYPSYVSWDDTHCAPNGEQVTESDIVSRPPVDNSPIGQSRAVVAQLHADIVSARAQRDMMVQLVDSCTPENRNSNRMPPELLQQWRQAEKRKRYLEFEEKIEALCRDLQREQATLAKLEQEEFEKLEQAAAPPIITTKDLANVYSKLMAEASRQ